MRLDSIGSYITLSIWRLRRSDKHHIAYLDDRSDSTRKLIKTKKKQIIARYMKMQTWNLNHAEGGRGDMASEDDEE